MEINFEKAVKSGVEKAMRECELTIGMTLKEAVERQVAKSQTPIQSFMDLVFALLVMLVLWITQPIIAETVVKN